MHRELVTLFDVRIRLHQYRGRLFGCTSLPFFARSLLLRCLKRRVALPMLLLMPRFLLLFDLSNLCDVVLIIEQVSNHHSRILLGVPGLN